MTLLILSRLESVRAWFRTEFVCAPVQALTALVPGPTLMAPPPKMPAATDLRKFRLPGVIALLFRMAVLPVLDGNATSEQGLADDRGVGHLGSEAGVGFFDLDHFVAVEGHEGDPAGGRAVDPVLQLEAVLGLARFVGRTA